MEDSREGTDTDNENGENDETEQPASNSSAPSTSSGLPHLPSNNRIQRNLAEKMRRDKLNTYISELATLVPMVSRSPKRMDKTSILRLTATYLRMNRTLYSGEREQLSLPKFLEATNFSQTLLEEMNGFLLIVTSAGKIVFVTHTVEKILGHSQNDLFGQSLYNITCPEDHTLLTKNLTPDSDPSAPSTSSAAQASSVTEDSSDGSTNSSIQSCSSPRPLVPVSCRDPPPLLERQKRSFHIRLSQRAASRSESVNYETVHIQGHLRIPQLTKDDSSNASRKNDTVLVAVVKLAKECRVAELSLLEANRDEYITRHLIDGRFIYCDHRISVVSGYFPEEVSGVSAFKFMHQEDFLYTVIALRQMYDRYQEGEGYGSSVYRLRCKTGEYIYMRTHGYVEYSKTTHQVESFICVNTLISQEEGEVGLKEMRERYSATIKNVAKDSILASSATGRSDEDDANEEKSLVTSSEKDIIDMAISKLIGSFPTPSSDDKLNEDVVNPPPDIQYVKVVKFSKSMPPTHIQAAQIGIEPTRNEQKKTPQRSPSIESTPASVVARSQLERPSVITERPSVFSVNPAANVPVRTESVFKRTSSVANESNEPLQASKRPHRSVKKEILPELSPVQYEQPILSPEQQHRVIMMRDSLEMQQTTTNVLRSARALSPVGLFSMDNSPVHSLSHSPGSFSMESGDISQFQGVSLPLSPQVDNDQIPPFVMDHNAPDLLDMYSGNASLLDIVEDNPYADPESVYIDPSLISPIEQGLNTEQQVAFTLYEQQLTRSHHELQSRMNQQRTQINSMVQDLHQVPRGNHVFGAEITQLDAEHMKQEEILHSIQQDHHRNSNCKEKLKVCTLKQNIGV